MLNKITENSLLIPTESTDRIPNNVFLINKEGEFFRYEPKEKSYLLRYVDSVILPISEIPRNTTYFSDGFSIYVDLIYNQKDPRKDVFFFKNSESVLEFNVSTKEFNKLHGDASKEQLLNFEDNIYILKQYDITINDYIYKVGKTTNFKVRLNQYKITNPTIEVVSTFYIPEHNKYEYEFHKYNKSIYANEWYSKDVIIESGILEYAKKPFTFVGF